MKRFFRAETIWLCLLGLTLMGAWLSENATHGTGLAGVVALLIALKGRLVIDYYMGMREANRRIRRVLYGFIVLVPLMVLISHFFGSTIARITVIG